MDPATVAVIATLATALGVIGKKVADIAMAAIKEKKNTSKKGANTVIVESKDREDRKRLLTLLENLEDSSTSKNESIDGILDNIKEIKAVQDDVTRLIEVNDERHAPDKLGDREEYSWKLSMPLKRALEKIPDLLQSLVDYQKSTIETFKLMRTEQEVLNQFLRTLIREFE